MKKFFFCLASTIILFGFFNQILESEEVTSPTASASTAVQPASKAAPTDAVPLPPMPPAGESVVVPAASQTAVEPAAGATGAGQSLELKSTVPIPPEPAAVPARETSEGSPDAKMVPKGEPASAKEVPIGFVAPLTDLVQFHEEGIADLKKTIERWNEKLRVYLEREKGLVTQKDKFNKQLSEKSAQDSKGNKREIVQLKKQVKSLEKDLKVVRKDLEKIQKDLIAELKEMGNFAGKAIGEKFSQVKQKVKAFGQEVKE